MVYFYLTSFPCLVYINRYVYGASCSHLPCPLRPSPPSPSPPHPSTPAGLPPSPSSLPSASFPPDTRTRVYVCKSRFCLWRKHLLYFIFLPPLHCLVCFLLELFLPTISPTLPPSYPIYIHATYTKTHISIYWSVDSPYERKHHVIFVFPSLAYYTSPDDLSFPSFFFWQMTLLNSS